MQSGIDFHLIVKKKIKKILIKLEEDLFTEMIRIPIDSETAAFNATVNSGTKEVCLILLGDLEIRDYHFDQLFNFPLNLEKKESNNMVIINTNFDVKFTLIKVSKYFQTNLGLPEIINLLPIQDLGIDLFPGINLSPEDKWDRGIDPNAKQFMKVIPIKNNWKPELKQEFLKELENQTFRIECYSSFLIRNLLVS